MQAFHPFVDSKINEVAPGYRALSMVVAADGMSQSDAGGHVMIDALAALNAGSAFWAEAHLAAWANAFRNFGAKPQRTPCSAEALRRRALRDGNLPSINPIVDLYNAVSIQYAIPVGGEDLDAYAGTARLTVADGSEIFDTIKEGVAATESPEPGEVIWRDDIGVTCRRWNWRQGVRTRLTSDSTHMWFILESLPEMPLDALREAGEKLEHGLSLLLKNPRIAKELVHA